MPAYINTIYYTSDVPSRHVGAAAATLNQSTAGRPPTAAQTPALAATMMTTTLLRRHLKMQQRVQ